MGGRGPARCAVGSKGRGRAQHHPGGDPSGGGTLAPLERLVRIGRATRGRLRLSQTFGRHARSSVCRVPAPDERHGCAPVTPKVGREGGKVWRSTPAAKSHGQPEGHLGACWRIALRENPMKSSLGVGTS